MITATTNIKEAIGDIQKLRKLLGISAEQQGRELAGSCAYVAARLSYPQVKGRDGGGAKLDKGTGTKQMERIKAMMFAYSNVTQKANKKSMRAGEIVSTHSKRVRAGSRIASVKIIERSQFKHISTSERFLGQAQNQIIKRVGWNKAAWIKAMREVNPAAKQSVPAYISRHIGSAKGKADASESNGKWTFTMTNSTKAAEEVFGRGEFSPAANAAAEGQAGRYASKIRKLIKEARLA